VTCCLCTCSAETRVNHDSDREEEEEREESPRVLKMRSEMTDDKGMLFFVRWSDRERRIVVHQIDICNLIDNSVKPFEVVRMAKMMIAWPAEGQKGQRNESREDEEGGRRRRGRKKSCVVVVMASG
jgi:hypothetical protein